MNMLHGQSAPDDTKLDELLKTWAGACSTDNPDRIGCSVTEDRLMHAILSAVAPGSYVACPPRVPASGRGGWGSLVASAAAVILVAVSFAISPTSIPKKVVAHGAGGSQEKLATLWRRTSDVFGPHLNWLCDLDGELLLGVNAGAATVSGQDRAFVLLTVRERDSGNETWSPIWTGRVVCPLGEAVDFVSGTTRSGGTVWVQARPDGRLVASHWLNWPQYPEISGSVDTVVASGESRVVAEQISNGHSIQVVQQVWMPSAS